MIRLVLGVLLSLACICPAMAEDPIRMPCEVMEVSPAFQTQFSRLKDIHYLIIHHANAADRTTLSTWLKAHSGAEVIFVVNEKRYRGVLCRMAHCFGRGLLIYTDPVKVSRRDIIEVVLPLSSP